MNPLQRQQAQWDAIPPPPPPPSTALLSPAAARGLPYKLLIGLTALYFAVVLAKAALRIWS